MATIVACERVQTQEHVKDDTLQHCHVNPTQSPFLAISTPVAVVAMGCSNLSLPDGATVTVCSSRSPCLHVSEALLVKHADGGQGWACLPAVL